ncbi:MAG: glycosyltransferase [Microbacterium sp.]
MSALFHAIVVARATAAAPADRLRRTLEAIRAQTRPVDGVTVVVCGKLAGLEEATGGLGVDTIIKTGERTRLAEAVALADAKIAAERSTWILTQDAFPERTALAALAAALERGPSVGLAAPKLVDEAEPTRLVSLGVSMTRFGRTVPLANGEADQGQHDGDDDVLGADVRGLVIREDMRQALVLDPALAGADEGLDLGVRARLAGRRVALAPEARVAVVAGGEGSLPTAQTRRAYAVRTAQLHRRLVYAPVLALPLHWLLLLPLAFWRSMVDLVAKRPQRVPIEWGAAVTVLVRLRAVARARRRLRRFRAGGWSQVDPLRATAAQLRERYDDEQPDPVRERDLGFFSGGGAWAVLGGLVVSAVAFFSLLAWPALGGGALMPLADTVGSLWRDALPGARSVGLHEATAADPFSAIVALIGSAWPVAPSFTVVALWVLALPLSVLGGWFAATRVSDRSGVRVLVGVLYALSPTLIAALTTGRPAAVVAHLLLPWLFYAAAAAHRSWGASGAASLLLLGVVACAPSLAPLIAFVWIVVLVLTLVVRAFTGAARVIWLIVPAAVWFAPILLTQLGRGTPLAALADPGVAVAVDATPSWLLAAGFPTPDPGGWLAFVGADFPVRADLLVWIVPLLCAPVAVLALLAPLTARWRLGAGLVALAVLGVGTAFAAAGVQVAFTLGEPVALWPGSGLSAAWLAVALAAAVTLDIAPMPGSVRGLAAVLAAVCVAGLAVPGLTAVARGDAVLTNGPTSTLPAYVGAEAAAGDEVGTLLLSPKEDGSVATRVVWGESETLGGQSTLESTDVGVSDDDRMVARLAGDLMSSSNPEATEALGELGLRFVLLSTGADELSDAERNRRLTAVTSIDQRDGFTRVGQTARGVLWRLEADPAPRPGLSAGQAAAATTGTAAQGLALLAAILLSVPTAQSRRQARAMPRVIGRGYEEER